MINSTAFVSLFHLSGCLVRDVEVSHEDLSMSGNEGKPPPVLSVTSEQVLCTSAINANCCTPWSEQPKCFYC